MASGGKMQKPERIVSARMAAKRLGVSHQALSKHLRRGLVQADYESDCGSFFRSENIPVLREAISANRQKQWRHCGTAESPACGFAA
jgi:hypothetical protein